MPDKWARILGVVVVIALGWVGVYWWMSPSQPKISFDGSGPGAAMAKAPAPQQREKPVMVDVKRSPLVKQGGQGAPTSPLPPKTDARQSRTKQDLSPPVTGPVVEPPRFNSYTVRDGDTIESIATMELGSAKLADAIRRANPLKDMTRLKTGDVIRIPVDPTNIQGKPSPSAPAPTPPAGQTEVAVEYTVKAGDSLSKIAKEQYGNTSYKDLIFQANRDRLKTENSLREGQKLRLPPKPAGG
jgi:nucleoid-associated protein YgaU